MKAELDGLQAEQERLRESEKMYRLAAEVGGRMVWSSDRDGNVTAMSRVFRSLTGVEEALTAGSGWLAFVHAEDRDRVAERWVQSMRTGEPFSAEFRSLLKDGRVRWVVSRAVAVRDDKGEIQRWYGSTEDIHDEWEARRSREEALARLRESEELHRLTVELTQQIVWSTDPDGTGLVLSSRYYDMTGMKLGSDALFSIHPDDRDRINETWQACLDAGTSWNDELRLQGSDGNYRYCRVRAAPLRDAEGHILRWYGVTVDAHEERLAEEARRDVEERYRLAVKATNDAVWDYDLRAGTIDWSDNSADIFGRPGEPIGRTSIGWWEERIHPDDRAATDASLKAAIDRGASHWSATYRFLKGDGSYADIFDRGFIIRSDDGEPVRAVGAMADLTQRHEAEAEIRRIQAELIHVSRLSAMGAMASTLAHELNQPLAAVSNFISGARRLAEKGGGARDHLLGALEAAATGAQRAGEIVRSLRELVSRGTVSVQAENLPRLIEEASVLGFVDAKLHGIRHRLELDPAARWVLADRVQIQQVLINLIRNAIEAMTQSTEREVVIASRATGREIEVSVADTGTGIAPEHVESLFSRFMTTKTGGMGIGLPISRTIVELHGGKIWAANRPEGGAVFRFTLPKARPSKRKAA